MVQSVSGIHIATVASDSPINEGADARWALEKFKEFLRNYTGSEKKLAQEFTNEISRLPKSEIAASRVKALQDLLKKLYPHENYKSLQAQLATLEKLKKSAPWENTAFTIEQTTQVSWWKRPFAWGTGIIVLGALAVRYSKPGQFSHDKSLLKKLAQRDSRAWDKVTTGILNESPYFSLNTRQLICGDGSSIEGLKQFVTFGTGPGPRVLCEGPTGQLMEVLVFPKIDELKKGQRQTVADTMVALVTNSSAPPVMASHIKTPAHELKSAQSQSITDRALSLYSQHLVQPLMSAVLYVWKD